MLCLNLIKKLTPLIYSEENMFMTVDINSSYKKSVSKWAKITDCCMYRICGNTCYKHPFFRRIQQGLRSLVLNESLTTYSLCIWAVKDLTSLHVCTHSPEPSCTGLNVAHNVHATNYSNSMVYPFYCDFNWSVAKFNPFLDLDKNPRKRIFDVCFNLSLLK